MRQPTARRNGASMLEFTFVGIPLIFVLITIFEISRGLWIFNTLSHSVKEGVRFAIVHGNNCVLSPNYCPVTPAQICREMQYQGPGLVPADMIDVTMSVGQIVAPTRTMSFPNLSDCFSGSNCTGDCSSTFPMIGPPTDGGGSIGTPLEIRAKYRFDSALAFYWTGSRGFVFGRVYLPASARERIRY